MMRKTLRNYLFAIAVCLSFAADTYAAVTYYYFKTYNYQGDPTMDPDVISSVQFAHRLMRTTPATAEEIAENGLTEAGTVTWRLDYNDATNVCGLRYFSYTGNAGTDAVLYIPDIITTVYTNTACTTVAEGVELTVTQLRPLSLNTSKIAGISIPHSVTNIGSGNGTYDNNSAFFVIVLLQVIRQTRPTHLPATT